ncbi:MAG: preprotein translocase subunit SecA [Candidatus Krumholzibacteria bacterium]|nr:preprotein translocase subunit SecA [Candidatus Krumholzibacteria bacterium]
MAKGLMGFIENVFGKKNKDVAQLQPLVDVIKAGREQYAALSDDELRAKRGEFAQRHADGESLDDLLAEAYGVVWEGCRRLAERKASWIVWGQEQVWDMIPYDVQLMGGIVLHQGKIAEMATGEGKTLVAIAPLYLNSIPGKGAHLVTVNDYLAQRDAQWMGGVLEFLGCKVGYILGQMTPEERREAYACDVTYGTNNEFGFDYLRDNMVVHAEHLVHREFHFAIVDEVDSVLIDEARTPLIISGAVDKSTHQFSELNPLVNNLVRQQMKMVNNWLTDVERVMRPALKGEDVDIDNDTALKLLRISRGGPKNPRFRKLAQIPGVLETVQKTEEAFMRDKAMWEADADLLYVVEEKNNHVDMTEKGRDVFGKDDSEFFVLPDLAVAAGDIQDNEALDDKEKAKQLAKFEQAYAQKNERISNVDQLLRAYSLYESDVEYVMQEGKVVIVDSFTGRLQPGRRFSDGLHQALEAKEGVTVQKETQTLATVTVQNFFRKYAKLSGMTGTAETEEAEFNGIYTLDVVVIPTNRPIVRDDQDDLIYKTKKEKYKAIRNEVARMHKLGLPVLVGTTTVEVSELISRMFKLSGINHNVLNAKQHKAEAEIVAEAGHRGAVTIATNMAGRGTDIKLAPEIFQLPESWPNDPNLELEEYEGQSPGLQIIGTERHESRRIDRQLRGRSGRQGDPGATIFFLSLEDDLMRLFSPDRIIKVMDRLGVEEGEVITHSMVTKAIEKAQVRVETQNYEIRKHLLEYDDVVNKQREVVYDLRRSALEGEGLDEQFAAFVESAVTSIIDAHAERSDAPDFWDMESVARLYQGLVLAPMPLEKDEHLEMGFEALEDKLVEFALERFKIKAEGLGEEFAGQLEKFVLIQILDEHWRDHLNELILLRSGIGLRSYGQRDPLVEYKGESFRMFETLMDNIEKSAVSLFFRAELAPPPEQKAPAVEKMQTQHQEVSAYEQSGAGKATTNAPDAAAQRPQQREEPKVGRNDPCPCGSGAKYKKCCGKTP